MQYELDTAQTQGRHGNLCPGMYRLRAWARRTDDYNGFRTLAYASQPQRPSTLTLFGSCNCFRPAEHPGQPPGALATRPPDPDSACHYIVSTHVVIFRYARGSSSLVLVICMYCECHHLVHRIRQECCSTADSTSTPAGVRLPSPPPRTAMSRLAPFRTHLRGSGSRHRSPSHGQLRG